MILFSFLLFMNQSWAVSKPCPPPQSYARISTEEKVAKFHSSKNQCEKFSLAYDLHFDGVRFQVEWGKRALEILADYGDYHSLATYALQMHDLLAFSDPNRESFHFYAIKGVNGVLQVLPVENDQLWIRWALGTERGDSRVDILSFESFLKKYPKNIEIPTVLHWKSLAIQQFFTLEKSIGDGLVKRKKYFAPIVRFESNLNIRSIQTSPDFYYFVWETVKYREIFRKNLRQINERDLKIWLRIEHDGPMSRDEISHRIRVQNCSDMRKVFKFSPDSKPTNDMLRFLDLC